MSNDPRALSDLSQADFDSIEQAVMETARGRWFLREYAARNRNADTNVLLEAIGKLQSAVTGEQAFEQIERVRFDLVEMAKSIARLKIELETGDTGGGEGSHFGDATITLDGIVQTTEQATSNILEAAESIQEIAWSLREQHFDEMVCDKIDKLATDIYTSCGFQDLTAQRTQKVVRTLRFLEGRINALVDAWSGPVTAESSSAAGDGVQNALILPQTAAPARPSPRPDAPYDMSQSDVDIVIVDDQFHARFDMPVAAGADVTVVDDEIDQPAWVHPGELIPNHARTATLDPDDGLMVADEQNIIIDDLEALDVDFIMTDADVVPDMTAKTVRPVADARMSATLHDQARAVPQDARTELSLAQMDALPTTAKALIYG